MVVLDFPDYAALMSMSDNGQVRLWGAKLGEDGRNEARWRRVAPGTSCFSFTALAVSPSRRCRMPSKDRILREPCGEWPYT